MNYILNIIHIMDILILLLSSLILIIVYDIFIEQNIFFYNRNYMSTKIITYNLCWEAFAGTKTRIDMRKCITCVDDININKCIINIGKIILDFTDDYDFMAFQEVSNKDIEGILLAHFPEIQSLKCLSHINSEYNFQPGSITIVVIPIENEGEELERYFPKEQLMIMQDFLK